MVQRARSPLCITSTLRNFPSSSISHFIVVSRIHLLPLNLAVQLLQPSLQLPAQHRGGGRRRSSGGIRTTRHVPEEGGDGCRVSLARNSFHVGGGRDCAIWRFGKKIVQPARVYFARLKIVCR